MIPVNEPLLDGNEREYLLECIETGWISSEGPFVSRFEEEFAARVGRTYGIAVCNGSVALELALALLDLGPGDEVILPTFTIISCAAAIIRAGAVPVVVDSDPDTWNMDVSAIESRITDRTRAIMVVHIYGLPVDMDAIVELADRHGLNIIEDAAEAHGQTYRGRPCGSFGAVSTFSFYPNKHVTTGEGGMVLTDDAQLADRARQLRNLAFKPPRRFVHEDLGWNFRMTNLQAAIGVAQLERLDMFLQRKRRMGERYSRLLRNISGLQLPLAATDYAENGYWVYGVVLDERFPFGAEEAGRQLAARGVVTRPFFWPLHHQPILRKLGYFDGETLPVAERLGERGFYLPSGLALTDPQIDTVAAAVREVLA